MSTVEPIRIARMELARVSLSYPRAEKRDTNSSWPFLPPPLISLANELNTPAMESYHVDGLVSKQE